MEMDLLFQSLVLSKISCGLPVYAASVPELNIVQQFLRRCHKRCFISYAADIYDLLEKRDSPGGVGAPHMKGMGMLVGNFELNP